MAERALRREIRRLVEDKVPASPWLEDRVLAAVLDDAAGRSRHRSESVALRLGMAAAAAVVIGVLAIGVLLSTEEARQVSGTAYGNPEPSKDTAVVRYRAILDTDMNAIYSPYYRANRCTTRETCIALAQKERNATQSLLNDMAARPAPAPLALAAEDVQSAGERLLEQLDLAIAQMQAPGTDFVAIAAAPSIGDLDRAVAVVTCWPVKPVVRGDLTEGFGCTAAPASDLSGHG